MEEKNIGSATSNGSLRRSLIYGLLLFWLTLGWLINSLLATNIYIWALIILWGGWFWGRNGPKPLTWPLLVFWAFGAFVSVLSGDTSSIIRIHFWAVLIAIYHIPHDHDTLRRAARWVSWPIFILSGIGLMWTDHHVMSMFIWGLFWLGMDKDGKWRYPYAALAGWALLMARCEGGYLAVLTGGAVWAWLCWPRHYRTVLGAGLATGLALAWVIVIHMKIYDNNSVWSRLKLYKHVWLGFIDSPITGHGLNTFFIHMPLMRGSAAFYWDASDPHNLFLGILWETGLVGILIALWLIFRLIMSYNIPPWASAWLTTFVAHSMVDEPIYSSLFTAATLFIIIGGLECKEKTTWRWHWPHRLPWLWPARPAQPRPH